MTFFEWWQVFLGLLTLLVPLAVTVLGWGFNQWAKKLSTFSTTVDQRLAAMQSANSKHWEEANARLSAHERELQRIHVCGERRLVRLETKAETH